MLVAMLIVLAGAVVESGSNEAAGGNDVSVSAGGKGAELLAAVPDGVRSFVVLGLPCSFFFWAHFLFLLPRRVRSYWMQISIMLI